MKKYSVTVHETVTHTYVVEADNAQQARDKVYNGVWQSGIVRRVIKSVRKAS